MASRAVSASATIRREGEQRLAGRGERDARRAALEQGGAEVRFEGVNLLTQRRLGHTDPLGRLGEMPDFGHCHEVSELLQLHDHSLSLST